MPYRVINIYYSVTCYTNHINSTRIQSIASMALMVFPDVEDCEELLVMGIVVQLGRSQCPRIKGDQVKLAIWTADGEDSGDCVVQSIGFNGDLRARLEVSKDGSCSEGLFQSIERMLALVSEVSRGIFPSKPSQGNHNIGVIEYELAVEVCKAQEGLYVLYLSGFRPIANCFYFVSRHCQAVRGEEISEVFHWVHMEFTLFGFGK